MECINDKNEGGNMLKRIGPWIVAFLVGGGLVYMMKPGVQEIVDNSVEDVVNSVCPTQATVEIINKCPKVVVCPPTPEPKYIVKWKTKLVPIEISKIEPGCQVDWKTGHTVGATTKDMNLRCIVDHETQTVDTQFWMPHQGPK